eukprot:TRINITY_DN17146_c0_g2_i1.p1 TRINITY_DN17146_c0_g2~~TRINITY_DN17146_c0_g2_i1.p1  ORF type:complete len:140 (+),score=36.71 TRINITY_DN17146_c0_g2_i1:309-728(+)
MEMQKHKLERDAEESSLEESRGIAAEVLNQKVKRVESELEYLQKHHKQLKDNLKQIKQNQNLLSLNIESNSIASKEAEIEFCNTLKDPVRFVKYARCLNNPQIQYLHYQIGAIIDTRKMLTSQLPSSYSQYPVYPSYLP